MSKNTIERLPLKDLIINKGTQPRVSLDQGVIKEYAEDITDALRDRDGKPGTQDNIPWVLKKDYPVVVRDEAGHCYLADGFHRYFAHKEVKLKEADVEIIPGTLRDAVLYSVSANASHGVRRTSKDKRRAVLTLLNDPEWSQWSDSEIARITNVSDSSVNNLRAKQPAASSPTTRKAKRKGKEISVKVKNIGKKSGKAGKSDASGPADPEDKELVKAITKISTAIGGEAGGAVRKAIETGSIGLSKTDVKKWSETSVGRIQKSAPLITELGFKPDRAFTFLDKDVNATSKLEELINHSLARGGQFEIKLSGYTILVLDDKKYAATVAHK